MEKIANLIAPVIRLNENSNSTFLLISILVVAYNLEVNDNGNVSSTDAACSRL